MLPSRELPTITDSPSDVLARPRFDRYVTIEDRQQFLRLLGRVAELVQCTISDS